MNDKIETVGLSQLSDANFPKDPEGRVYHVGLKYGELANRIMIMGDPERARTISRFFDNPDDLFVRVTTRGYTTYTGRYKGVPMSVMAIGMGPAMVDFLYRECRSITQGPLAFIRLGTCGTPSTEIDIGTVCVSDSSRFCAINYEACLRGAPQSERYSLTSPVKADHELVAELTKSLEATLAPLNRKVVVAGDITADSFYSSQGRIDPNFDDDNAGLIDMLATKHPEIGTLQMETFMMYYLSALCRAAPISSAACAIVLAQRKAGGFLDNDTKHQLEKAAGTAIFETLLKWGVGKANLMDHDPACIWNTKN